MGLEVLPDWLIFTVAVSGIIGCGTMVVRWLVGTIKSAWQPSGRGSNGSGASVSPKSCPLDAGFINSQLNNCEASREQAAMRDQQMLALLQQILNELQAIRAHEHDILQGITILLERNRASR